MKIFFAFGALLIGVHVFAVSGSSLVKRVQFASAEKAKQLLATDDDFTKSWSQFDIDSRLEKKNGKKEELIKYIISQVKEWTSAEKQRLTASFNFIDSVADKNGFKLNWPAQIYFVKTTGKEEGGAEGYTRGNYVVLGEQMLSQPDSMLNYLVAHELFHVLSRNDNEFRKKMYRIIHFELMEPVAYPQDLRDRRITNPDATQTDSYIALTTKKESAPYMIILYADKEYNGGDFFSYLQVSLLELSSPGKVALNQDKSSVVRKLDDVPEYLEKVGSNTQYIIHPDEIMADNFSFLMNGKKNLPSQWILDKMMSELK